MNMTGWASISQVKEKIAEKSAEEVTASYLERIKKSKINAEWRNRGGSGNRRAGT